MILDCSRVACFCQPTDLRINNLAASDADATHVPIPNESSIGLVPRRVSVHFGARGLAQGCEHRSPWIEAEDRKRYARRCANSQLGRGCLT